MSLDTIATPGDHVLQTAARKLVAPLMSLSSGFPEKSIRIFLTSYARKKGYIWSEANLTCMGRVLEFFVKYLLRSKVLLEIERALRRSLDVIALAIKELPNTSAMAKVNPDHFSRGCTNYWGKNAEGYTLVELDSRQNPFPEEPAASNIEEVNENAESKEKTMSGWGDNSGWGTAGTTEGGGDWGKGLPIDATIELNAWGETMSEEEKTAQWTIFQPKTLQGVGLSALSLTHKPGIVEKSMRRIKSIIPPPSNPARSPPLGKGVWDPDPDAVENDLERHYYRTHDRLGWGSVGAVADPDAPEIPEGNSRTHDPFKDEITLLIEPVPENVALLSVGMGLGGVWIQLVREGGVIVKKKKKGKSKSKKTIPNYWYMEEFAMTIPSFGQLKHLDGWRTPAT